MLWLPTFAKPTLKIPVFLIPKLEPPEVCQADIEAAEAGQVEDALWRRPAAKPAHENVHSLSRYLETSR